jgi:tetratricopeptide (TPR) repeat protein
MSRKQRKRKPRRPASGRTRAIADDAVALVSYEITWGPVTEIPENKLPPDLAAEIERVFFQLKSHPRDAIVDLNRLIERYPDCPKLFNFLGAAYGAIGDSARAEQIARDSYERFPNYLFARLIYADLCIARGDLDEIPVIFDGKYDLSLLCPNRKRFHVTEAIGFMGVMGHYFVKKGNVEQAKIYHKTLKELAPDDPNTKRLARLMQINSFVSMLPRWMVPQRT